MFLRRPLVLAAGLGLLGGGQETRPIAPAAGGFLVEHTPPACLVADKVPRLVACVTPRSTRASLRVLFRAEGGAAWYSVALKSDVPCYSGILPRPSRGTDRVVYVIEAQAPPAVARTVEYTVPVVAEAASCAGRAAPVATGLRPTWEAPPGAPRTPPGFEGAPPTGGTRAAQAPPVAPPSTPTTAVPPLRPTSPSAPTTAAPPSRPTQPAGPASSGPPAPTASAPGSGSSEAGGGHALRNIALVVVGLGAAGGAAAVATRKEDDGSPPASTGSGLPPSGVSGVYVGTETINYSATCSGTDDIVLNLQEAGGQVTGVLSFTVRTCPCCAEGRGANPVTGSVSGTSLQLATPIGFNYSGAFSGTRLSGALAGAGGITGTWTVDKR